MKANGHTGLWISAVALAVSFVGAAAVYGQRLGEQTEKLNSYQDRIMRIEETQKMISDMAVRQAVLETKFDNMVEMQEAYQGRTTKTLDRILDELKR